MFKVVGFPSEIQQEKEVFNFIDSMHDGRLDLYYDMGMKPTLSEFEYMKEVVNKTSDFAKKKYGKDIAIKAPLLSSMDVYRMIEFLTKEGEKPVCFEIGGGCGCLGTILHEKGYPYISTDVTQAFYIEQNHLWNGLFPDEVAEMVTMQGGVE